ncbi:unnamed protein product [Menidia menidia]|uniref:Fibroblast growth factor n=1 Tax=Menidia menidia TaxID=238744 RepID=A0A8S4AH01_9TELE|nr:unnamed protein product [Menidia menidia]
MLFTKSVSSPLPTVLLLLAVCDQLVRAVDPGEGGPPEGDPEDRGSQLRALWKLHMRDFLQTEKGEPATGTQTFSELLWGGLGSPSVQGLPTCPGRGHLSRAWPPVQGVATCPGPAHLSRVWPPVQGVATCPGCGHLSRACPPVQGLPTCPGCGHLSRVWPPVQGVATCPGPAHLSRAWPPVQGCGHLSRACPPVQGLSTCPGCGHLSRVWPPVQGLPTCPGCGHLSRACPPVQGLPTCPDREVVKQQLLYCRAGIGYHLQILPSGLVGGVHKPTEYCWLKVFALKCGVVGIRGVRSGLYLCMKGKGLAYGAEQFSDECLFRENLEENHYNTYLSYSHPGYYLALSRKGQLRRANSVNHNQSCTHFLPRTP